MDCNRIAIKLAILEVKLPNDLSHIQLKLTWMLYAHMERWEKGSY